MGGSDAAGIFGKGCVTAPVEAVFDAPVVSVEVEEAAGGGLRAGQAGDGIDGFLAEFAGAFSGSVDAADLGGIGPVEVAGEFAGGRQLALLDAAMRLLSGPSDLEIGRRAVPQRVAGRRLAAQRGDQLWGEKRRRRRRLHPPSGGVGWLLS